MPKRETRDGRRETLREKKFCAAEPTPSTNHPRQSIVIAFDFGMRNIGVAVGNVATKNSQALITLKAKDGIPQWSEIEALILEWQPQQLLVGLPLNMDGSDAEFAPHARKFANRLREKYKLPVTHVDERLTSFEAKQLAVSQGYSYNHKDKPVDAIAARIILESWLNSQ
jgi:putative holliday junction resolvase